MSNIFIKISFCFFAFCFFNNLSAQHTNKGKVHILYTPNNPSNTFIPSKNIGGALDGHEKGDIVMTYSPENIRMMQTVGLKPVSYRLRTELAGEVWHWNPHGKWSEGEKNQGYWVSDSNFTKPIEISNGYYLPRRGNTIDQANDDGYSRISDGDTATFWKSNPYLDEHFTMEPNSLHPQWVIVDLGALREVNAIRINWGNPYALSYTVDYALDIGSDYFEPFQPELWHSFPKSAFDNQKGELNNIRIATKPVKVRFVRIKMTNNSYSSGKESKDIRDKLGFAIKEIQVGLIGSGGKFHDWMHHFPNHKQSMIYVSSTDPWHRQQDIDKNVEQIGIDRFFANGLTAGQPALMPAALLYDTPENIIALVKYLKAKKYPVNELEIGEEPEGQLISPVDYAALYYQWGKQIRNVDPDMRMGGPGFATLAFTKDDSATFSEAKWTQLFLNYLKEHGKLSFFNFFSFEWYPFDDVCMPSAPQLAAAPEMLSTALENFRDILPENTPVYLSEYGYSAFEGKAEVEIEGALMYADILGKFLELGGNKSFLYGYEPATLDHINDCDYGNNILFGLGSGGKIKYKTAAFYGMQMLTHYWAQPADSILEIYPAKSDIQNKKKQPLVSSYALHSAAGKWSVMLINKDPQKTWNVDIDVQDIISKNMIAFHPENSIQYSKLQYHWINNGINGHPSLSLPPVIKKINSSKNISLPPYSLTIVN
jgi:hypothetical protein